MGNLKEYFCYYNTVISLTDEMDLITTTLWGHIQLQDAFQTESAITDFRRIRHVNGR